MQNKNVSSRSNDQQKDPEPPNPPHTPMFFQHHGFMLLEFSIKAVGLIVLTHERLAALRSAKHKGKTCPKIHATIACVMRGIPGGPEAHNRRDD